MLFIQILFLNNIQEIEIEEISKILELLLNDNYYSGATYKQRGRQFDMPALTLITLEAYLVICRQGAEN